MNAFVGGVSVNYNTNLFLGKDPRAVVTEADEFDRSFLQLSPDIAVISAVDADHLDIYGTYEHLLEAFNEFAEKLGEEGLLILNQRLIPRIKARERMLTYGLEDGDVHSSGIRVEQGSFVFDLITNEIILPGIRMGVPGRHNIENALAASAVAMQLGIEPELIGKALKTYKGVKRRFEILVDENRVKYVDDYAHHPDEIRACIGAARELWPGMKITGIFQPHLFTRTRDLAREFAQALGTLDALVLLPIYPAREEPIEGINSEMLAGLVSLNEKKIIAKDLVAAAFGEYNEGVLLTMGAGDIDQCVEPLRECLLANLQKEGTR
jgi:UDP-N-acetylmuramate--alanine ligase